MKQKPNPEILSYLKCCLRNLQNEEQNAYLDAYVTKETEKKMQRALKAAGQKEFDGPEAEWPSLFLSAEDWKQNPYYQNIRLDQVSDGGFRYEKEWIEGGYLFNAEAIQDDPDRSCADWMKLRALDQDVEGIYLYQNDEDWMMCAPSEAYTNDPPAHKAHGKVLTFGLGIGYFVYMTMRNPSVSSITVVEKSPQVLDMFRKNLLPQFPDQVPLRLIEGDALDWFQKDALSEFDYIYTDIWRSSEDGLDWMEKLLEQDVPFLDQADFWIEDSCILPMRTLLVMAMYEWFTGVHQKTAPGWEARMKKTRTYLSSLDHIPDDPESLKTMLYDRMVYRNILSL